MTVGDLIKKLEEFDPDLEIAAVSDADEAPPTHVRNFSVSQSGISSDPYDGDVVVKPGAEDDVVPPLPPAKPAVLIWIES